LVALSVSLAAPRSAADTLKCLEQEVNAEQDPASLVLHVGDISYANGDPDIWDSFMDGIQPIASRVPYMVAIGNHEYGYRKGSGAMVDPSGAAGPYQPSWGELQLVFDAIAVRRCQGRNMANLHIHTSIDNACIIDVSDVGALSCVCLLPVTSAGNFGADSRGECGVMMARRFHMPENPGQDALDQPAPNTPSVAGSDASSSAGGRVRATAPFWYSFDYGSVHFTVISTENDLSPGSSQHAWLQEDLAAVDRWAPGCDKAL
jgi:hypothetical protein